MPWLAAGSGLAAAALAALPLTVGFFKDELFFTAAVEHSLARRRGGARRGAHRGLPRPVLGRGVPRPAPAPGQCRARLVAPVVVLGGLVLLGGIVVRPYAVLAGDAATVTAGVPVVVDPAYHLDLRVENVMALAAYALGLLLLAGLPLLGRVLGLLRRAGEAAGPERLYVGTLSGLNRLSNAIHDIEVRDLRGRVVAVLVPAGLLVGVGVAATPFEGAYRVGAIAGGDLRWWSRCWPARPPRWWSPRCAGTCRWCSRCPWSASASRSRTSCSARPTWRWSRCSSRPC